MKNFILDRLEIMASKRGLVSQNLDACKKELISATGLHFTTINDYILNSERIPNKANKQKIDEFFEKQGINLEVKVSA